MRAAAVVLMAELTGIEKEEELEEAEIRKLLVWKEGFEEECLKMKNEGVSVDFWDKNKEEEAIAIAESIVHSGGRYGCGRLRAAVVEEAAKGNEAYVLREFNSNFFHRNGRWGFGVSKRALVGM